MKTNSNVIEGLTDKRYIGKTCAKHPELGGLRIKNNRSCVGCVKLRKKRYREANKPLIAKYNASYYTDNRDYERLRVFCYQKSNPSVGRTINARRLAAKLNRTVAWADQEAIKAIYKQAQETGMSVDHIVPLQGKLVSGLHVEYNLQLLPPSENFAKCNKFEPLTIDGEWK